MLIIKKSVPILLAGPTNSGKTSFVLKLIQFAPVMFDPPLEKIIYCYSIWQSVFDKMSQVEFVAGLPDLALLQGPERKLLILDDLMQENPAFVTDLFTKHSHHTNTTVVHLVQNLFHKQLRTISLNARIIIVFKNSRDSGQFMQLARQAFPGRSKLAIQAYEDATKKAYTYLMCDFRDSTPQEQRLSTGVFPNEVHYVYL